MQSICIHNSPTCLFCGVWPSTCCGEAFSLDAEECICGTFWDKAEVDTCAMAGMPDCGWAYRRKSMAWFHSTGHSWTICINKETQGCYNESLNAWHQVLLKYLNTVLRKMVGSHVHSPWAVNATLWTDRCYDHCGFNWLGFCDVTVGLESCGTESWKEN